MKIDFMKKKRGCQKNNVNIWKKMMSVVLCIVMIYTSIGGTFTAFATAHDLSSYIEQKEGIYTLHLTHYLRFTVNGVDRNIQTKETIELTDADFKDGLCDLKRFAYDEEQLMVTEANPLSIDDFGENHESGARIVYAVNSGWQIVPTSKEKNRRNVQREIFQGQLTDYEFVPANVVTFTIDYQYSKTGGLFGISPHASEAIQALATEDGENYVFEVPIKSKSGFRIVLDSSHLDWYLNK